jgi:hypothetical protein
VIDDRRSFLIIILVACDPWSVQVDSGFKRDRIGDYTRVENRGRKADFRRPTRQGSLALSLERLLQLHEEQDENRPHSNCDRKLHQDRIA